jgi:hypothetical protein
MTDSGMISQNLALPAACAINFWGHLGIAYFVRHFHRNPPMKFTPEDERRILLRLPERTERLPEEKPVPEEINIPVNLAWLAGASVVGFKVAVACLK